MSKALSPYGDFHDARFVGVEYSSDDRVVLSFKLVNGARKEVVLEKVRFIRICDFIWQNVVSRLFDSNFEGINSSVFLDNKVEWLYALSDGTPLINDKAMDEIKMGIRDGSFRLFCLEPSWGAELVCLCDR
ncbi:hypothetical protein OII53_28470 [Achromobacter ruhlandii]|uniref:hypothetical protein n=1 Tax=Achromobacter ruhlandii TaxID=72557 RepID=UPI0012FD6D0C|nr:hypothetical protein [Achromobacter ruhlandii]MCV6799968.1 hypothetical protein [Achromobacter ruhlandii]MCV6802773.1 hypothetical protein [Achromobacter ruhlandii]MCV6812376.1 hypothetical protein [Achromobacter ruhlandii]MCV6822505.1 hypothetical protein [Achromobacter ruhlandii]